jgi:hypothetical protein
MIYVLIIIKWRQGSRRGFISAGNENGDEDEMSLASVCGDLYSKKKIVTGTCIRSYFLTRNSPLSSLDKMGGPRWYKSERDGREVNAEQPG